MLLLAWAAIACPVCEKQQPKILQGITHGSGPQSNWDYIIISDSSGQSFCNTFLFNKMADTARRESQQTILKELILNYE